MNSQTPLEGRETFLFGLSLMSEIHSGRARKDVRGFFL